MRLTFLGATHEVTGSCYYLEACGKKLLIDCGMEQGADCFENQPVPVNAAELDMVLLTHAHIDHSGKLPLLTKEGFRGQIFSTEGTYELCRIMLMDSAHIQETEAEWKNRKAERAGKDAVQPLYTTQDAADTLKCFVGLPYGEERIIAEGIRIRFIDAGHLLGSASIEIMLDEEGISRKIIFSGDIGNTAQPMISDPTPPEEADYIVMESTYGTRTHERPTDYTTALAAVLQRTFDRGGNVVIPSFAVGRTQEMLYFIRQIKDQGLVSGHDGFEVYVDSPLAVEATTIFQKRMFHDFDEEARALLAEGINPIGFEGLKVSVTSDDSKQINLDAKPKVILSASGMCEAGRIRHHLKHNLWRKESTILFVGYQAEGTVGRHLVEGADKVKLFGEEISVNAEILVLPGISGHADVNGLLSWVGNLKRAPKMVFVTHGEDSVVEAFKDRVHEQFGFDTYAPFSGTVYDLAKDELVYEAPPVPVEKPEGVRSPKPAGKEAAEMAGSGLVFADGGEEGRTGKAAVEHRPPSKAYRELLAAGERLLLVIAHNEGGANHDLQRMAGEINKLCERWDR